MTQQYALSFSRDGMAEPAYTLIPAGTEPKVELEAFFTELDRNHIDHCETDRAGVYEVKLLAGQRWTVQVIPVGNDDTQPMQAVAS